MSDVLPRAQSAFPAGAMPLLLTFYLLASAFDASANAEPITKRLDFDVYLGDRPIGSHQFLLQRSADATTVEIDANFRVKVLFVTAFAYEHNTVETWRGDCLQRIDASTTMNGDRYLVDGRQTAKGFVVDTDPSMTVAGNTSCASSFAYWDRSLLSAGALLNSQTGEFTPTELVALGNDQLSLGQTSIPVQRYALRGEGVDMTLSYASTPEGKEEWVGLESKVKGGRTLRYVRTRDSLTLPETS